MKKRTTIERQPGMILRLWGFAIALGVTGAFLFACAPEQPEPIVPPPEEGEFEEPAPGVFPADPEPAPPTEEQYQDHEGLEQDAPRGREPLWPEEETE